MMMLHNCKRVAIVAAHPDDEVLGMGGTIRSLVNYGSIISVLFLSSGVGARKKERESAEARKSSAVRALSLLGVVDIQFKNFPDNEFDTVPRLHIAKVVEDFLARDHYDTVFTNSRNDLNVDHRMTAEAVLIASRPLPSSSIHRLFHFETLSSTEWNFGSEIFKPSLFVDTQDTFQDKLKSLDEYSAELESFPHPRSKKAIEALGLLRGSQSGYLKAEAFSIGFIRA
jgi:N-acetylglucosamine malate deacetylase 1